MSAQRVGKAVLRSEKVWDVSRAGFTHPQPFSQGIRVPARGNLLFIAGQVALDREGNVVGVGDARAQTRQALENLKAMVEAGGGTLDDVVRLTVFVTDMRLFPQVQEVRAEYFSQAPPASTSIEVSALVRPELVVEIDAIAVIPDQAAAGAPAGGEGSSRGDVELKISRETYEDLEALRRPEETVEAMLKRLALALRVSGLMSAGPGGGERGAHG